MSALCRGCGGSGLDHALSPRQVQMVKGIHYCHKTGSNQVMSIEIVPVDRKSRMRTGAHGPLAYIVEIMAHYRTLGYYAEDFTMEQLKAMACSWCHGTGVPQLSAATMAMAVGA